MPEGWNLVRSAALAAVGLQPGDGAVLSVDQNPAARASATGGSFPKSILIPGTDTSIKIYGQITEIVDYWLSGGNPNASPPSTAVGGNGQVQAIPLPNTAAHARGNGIFLQSPRESRIGFETRTPTAFGEARTVVEFDWAGSNQFVPGGVNPASVSDNLIPRIRYAYGALGGILAGQATSNFSDPDANSETLDFVRNIGEPGVTRIPQIRYTMPAWWGGSFSLSAETPETDIGTPAGIQGSDAGVIPSATTSCTVATLGNASACSTTLLTSGRLPVNPAKSTAPDFTVAYYLSRPWGHFDISAVVRPGLDVEDGAFLSRHFIGFGGHIGMDIKPGWFGWVKDDFTFHITGGNALGRYLSSNTNFALATNYGAPGAYGSFGGPTSAASAAAILVKPTFEWGSEIGYQHWWLDNLRSNINAGFNAHNIPSQLIGAGQLGVLNKEVITAHTNLIWNPVSSVDVGIEYMWGQRTVASNAHGTENVLITRLRLSF
jgi:hypothetical protein